jgi:16S rRNA processing protein RimM
VVCVPRAALPTLEEGEYYLVDLVGLSARDPAGEVIGRVHDVIAYPSVECLVMQCGDVWREVPDLPRYVLEVHVREGYVVVDHLDELEPVKAPEKR